MKKFKVAKAKKMNGGHVKNIPLFVENILLLKKYIFDSTVMEYQNKYEIETQFSVLENFKAPMAENLSERKVLDWIYKTGNFDEINFDVNPKTLFKSYACQMVSIVPSSSENFEGAYCNYLESKKIAPRTARGGLKSNVRGCLSMAEIHNLFLNQYFKKITS